jgi:hypothetical protein
VRALRKRDEYQRLLAAARDLESAFAEGHTDEQWQSIADHLGEHVQNGLI